MKDSEDHTCYNLYMQIVSLIATVILCELVGAIGSFFTRRAIAGWYAKLKKPALSPPNWVFGPVWATLYALMGIAAFLVSAQGPAGMAVEIALMAFGIQLILNIAWSAIFFGEHDPVGAFAEIVLLWLSIFATIILFYPISAAAAYILLPYFAWVTFAGYLNFAIWRLNG